MASIYGINVGKYSSPMEHMGNGWNDISGNKKLYLLQIQRNVLFSSALSQTNVLIHTF